MTNGHCRAQNRLQAHRHLPLLFASAITELAEMGVADHVLESIAATCLAAC